MKFWYGALGAVIPEALLLLRRRGDFEEGELRIRAIAMASLATLIWVIVAGFFATALPGEVAKLTALYAGMSLPATVGFVSKAVTKPGGELEIDCIELGTRPSLSRHLGWYLWL